METQSKKHIVKVRGNEKQKQVTIPYDADEIKVGDYVEVSKR